MSVPKLSTNKRDERGSVTAEFAVAIPALIVMLTLLVSAAQWGSAHLAAQDAARSAARAVARGDPPESPSARCSLSISDADGTVRVSARCTLTGPIVALLGGTTSADAVAIKEAQ